MTSSRRRDSLDGAACSSVRRRRARSSKATRAAEISSATINRRMSSRWASSRSGSSSTRRRELRIASFSAVAMSTTEPTQTLLVRPKRADARRNYEKVLAAAREAFAEGGESTALEEIARRAGVGIGTLYRNFPNRQALIEALYLEEVEEVCRWRRRAARRRRFVGGPERLVRALQVPPRASARPRRRPRPSRSAPRP